MPVNCTQCGAKLEPGQRFCIQCGAAVENAPIPDDRRPDLDLSDYFDDAPRGGRPRPAAQPAKAPRPQTKSGKAAPAKKTAARKAAAEKSDRGLNIALLICGVLAIAVLVFMLFLLLWPKETPALPQPAVSSIPTVSQEPQSIVVPTPDVNQPEPVVPSSAPAPATDTPVMIITPSPLPSAAPVSPATPTPTPGAVAIITPSPTPGPDYLLPNSDSHYLTVDDIKGLSHEELCFARNEIFARHGRIFKTPQLAAYFNSKSWYHGTISPDKFDENVLNKYEWANVNLIREYENKYYGGSYY
jgi:hypothetical protein